MFVKKAYFSVDLELLTDIKGFNPYLKKEPNYNKEIEELLNFLDRHLIKATFFACYNYMLKNEEIIKKILLRGHDLALHYINHLNEEVSIDEFTKEIKLAKEDVLKRFGVDLTGYRAPAFNLTEDQYLSLVNLGFKYDSSYFVYKKAIYYSTFKINSLLKEFPVWETNKFPLSGGAYLRLLPNFLMKRKFKFYLKRNIYYNFYIHPYDYSGQNMLKDKAPLKIKLFFNRGTKNYLKRIKWMINELTKKGFIFKLYKEDLVL